MKIALINRLKIGDARDKRNPTVVEITEKQRELLKQCAVPFPTKQLHSEALEELIEKSLIIQMEGKCLSLVEIDQQDVEKHVGDYGSV